LLKPVIKFCLKRSIKFQEFTECAKQLFCELSQSEFAESSEKLSASRVSVITGLSRREVTRFSSTGKGESKLNQPNFIAKVISEWGSKRFKSSSSKTRILSCEGKSSEFAKLVSSISQDLNPYTVLNELERTGCIERVGNKVKLKTDHYISKGKTLEGYELLGKDLDNLIQGVEQNILALYKTPNLHLRTFYDNISPDDIEHIKKWLLAEGDNFHRRAREFLEKFDRGSHHDKNENPIQVSLTAFSFINPTNIN
jgi:hypothetical protein